MANGRKRKSKIIRKKGSPVQGEIEQFVIISSEKKKEQELRQSHRITDLKTCIHFINEAATFVERQREKQQLLDKWNAYANCDSMPKPNIPADVRAKMAQFRLFEQINVELTRNWLLLADEHSLLSQDIFCNNMTKKKLLATAENEFEPQYVQTIDTYLEMLRRIEYFFKDDKERNKATKVALDQIEVLKEELQNEIRALLNRYTYRVLSAGFYNKTSLDPLTWEHAFVSSNFEMQIWGLKNVPIRWTHTPEPRLLVDFRKLNLILHIPYSMLREGLTIQAVHTNFDHVSERIKYFEPHYQKSTETLSSCMKELSECLLKEFDLQNEIQQEVRKQLVRNYEEYKKKEEEFLQAQNQKKSENGKNNKKQKIPKGIKMPKAPQKIDDDEYPDIFQKFLQKESRDHKTFMDNIHSAQVIHLTDDEINLKKFVILGGIYELNCIQTPAVTDFGNYNMVWHLNNRNLVVDGDARMRKYSTNTHRSRNQSMLEARQSGTNILNPNLEALREKIDAENPFFVLVIEIPEYLCYWSEPIVCQYEVTERPVRVEQKFERLGSKTSDLEISHLDNIAEDQANMAEQSTIVPGKPGIADGCYVKDFPLNRLMSLEELRKIEKFCVPQMISSFKFNKEIQEDEQGKRKEKSTRVAAPVMLRKWVSSLNKALFHHFNYDAAQQNNPERLFTIFEEAESLHFLSILDNFSPTPSSAPTTFYQLINTLKLIKQRYEPSFRDILDLPEFQAKFDVAKKWSKKHEMQKPTIKPISVSHIKRVTKRRSELRGSSSSFNRRPTVLKGETSTESTCDGSERDLKAKRIKYEHWTTRHIRSSQYIEEERKIIIETDRLGIFGLAYDRYEHFPFKYWELRPSESNPENEVIFILETRHVECTLYITSEGIRGEVTEPSATHIKNPKKYLTIDKPINDYLKFQKLLKERHINIFPNQEAYYYIDKGYFSPKHLATEMHTYCCMALHCTQVMFKHSIWNRISRRRDIILEYNHVADNTLNRLEVHITPEQATFVQVSEICSEDLDEIRLAYNLTWRNLGFYSDLHQTICSVYPDSLESRCRNSELICSVKSLLSDIKPLSFS
ncbi:uncharacterized protein ACN2A1_011102 isoform 1-T1 [Glossina fuscipes fuscipes]|nr:hypothetical protein GQX74_007930 [Glossina fuscipes]